MYILTLAGCNAPEKELPAPTVYFKDTLVEVRVGDLVELYPKITYDYNSTYLWYKNGERFSTGKNISYQTDRLGEDIYNFVVDNSNGRDSITVTVRTVIMVDFKDDETYPLNDRKYNLGSRLTDNEKGFRFYDIFFQNRFVRDTLWNGFALSGAYSMATQNIPNFAARATAVSGNVFAVYHLSDELPDLNRIYMPEGKNYLVGTIDVCNTAFVYDTIRYGVYPDNTPHYQIISETHAGDSLAVVFTGYNSAGAETGTVTALLANYRVTRNNDIQVNAAFAAVNLKPLGYVNSIAITFISSATDPETGKNVTPPYVCIDNLKIFDEE
jgi:restriction endonuclease S subunit